MGAKGLGELEALTRMGCPTGLVGAHLAFSGWHGAGAETKLGKLLVINQILAIW